MCFCRLNDSLFFAEIRKDFFRKRLLLPTIALAEDGSFQDIEVSN